jgi:choline dehydrogenase-like flavoprotein
MRLLKAGRHLQDRVRWFTQAKVVGGGSSMNAQIYTRSNRRDYDAWADECGWAFRGFPCLRVADLSRAFGHQRELARFN